VRRVSDSGRVLEAVAGSYRQGEDFIGPEAGFHRERDPQKGRDAE
jgi:hypothetical protein